VTQVGLDILDADEALVRLVTATLQGATARSAEMAAAARG
jgi:pyrroline-5-carboxylate reductase